MLYYWNVLVCYNPGEAGELRFPCGCWRWCQLSRDCCKASCATGSSWHSCREYQPQSSVDGEPDGKQSCCVNQAWGRHGCNVLAFQNYRLLFIKASFLLLPDVCILFLVENVTGRLCLCLEGRRLAVFSRCSWLWRWLWGRLVQRRQLAAGT